MKHSSLQICFLGLLFLHLVNGHPGFASEIPNGGNVIDPCKPGTLWLGVGHLVPGGAGPRNVFGKDFERAGFKWTRELCLADSDNDGFTNGKELGDPECLWEPGQALNYAGKITHPGIPAGQCDPIAMD